MSDVMRDNEKKNEELKITLKATESNLGGPLSFKELADYRNSRQMFFVDDCTNKSEIIK